MQAVEHAARSASAQTANGPLATRLHAYRKPIVIGLAILLAWAVITHSLVAYLSDTSPEVAYWLHATPTVLLNLADDKLNADAAHESRRARAVIRTSSMQAAKRSYAKGIQSIEKLDRAQRHQRNPQEDELQRNLAASGADNLS